MYALRVSPAVTRLTVYRRCQVGFFLPRYILCASADIVKLDFGRFFDRKSMKAKLGHFLKVEKFWTLIKLSVVNIRHNKYN